MENDYKELLSQAVEFNGIEELYDLLIDEPAGETYRLVIPKTDAAKHLLIECRDLPDELNEEHLKRQGILMPSDCDDWLYFFEQHKDQCIFGLANTRHNYDLDTPGHPFPWLLYICFNGSRTGISNTYLSDLYQKYDETF